MQDRHQRVTKDHVIDTNHVTSRDHLTYRDAERMHSASHVHRYGNMHTLPMPHYARTSIDHTYVKGKVTLEVMLIMDLVFLAQMI